MAAVLIVEDDANLRGALAEHLGLAGCRAAFAADGAQALEYLRKHRLPRIIVLDLMMPNMDGWQFREAQLADARLRDIPVVIITAGGLQPSLAQQPGVA